MRTYILLYIDIYIYIYWLSRTYFWGGGEGMADRVVGGGVGGWMRPGRMFLERSRVVFDHVVIISSQSHRFERRWRDGFSRGARNSRISDHWAGLERERGLREEYIRIYKHVSVCVCACSIKGHRQAEAYYLRRGTCDGRV